MNNIKEKSKGKNDNSFVIVLLIIVVIIVLLFPEIYNYIEKVNLPSVGNTTQQNSTEEKQNVTIDDLNDLHFPIMRSSSYDTFSYYSLDKFEISDMSNNDILYNAFLDIYEGNMTSYNGTGICTNISKQFDEAYIKLRIKNILGKNIEYTLEDFYVPEDAETTYVGGWRYDKYNSRFTYKGLCTSKAKNTMYYDLEQLIKAEYSEKDIIVYYYVGFAKVENGNYTIYSDYEMTKVLDTGVYNYSDLNSIFEKINNNSKNIYKYTFKNSLCTYGEYCLYKGEWINEL